MPCLGEYSPLRFREGEVLICLWFRTWPVNEQIVDLLHKGVFAAVTGYVADRLILGQSLNA